MFCRTQTTIKKDTAACRTTKKKGDSHIRQNIEELELWRLEEFHKKYDQHNELLHIKNNAKNDAQD